MNVCGITNTVIFIDFICSEECSPRRWRSSELYFTLFTFCTYKYIIRRDCVIKWTAQSCRYTLIIQFIYDKHILIVIFQEYTWLLQEKTHVVELTLKNRPPPREGGGGTIVTATVWRMEASRTAGNVKWQEKFNSKQMKSLMLNVTSAM